MAMEDAAVLAAELEGVHARRQGLAQGLENYVARRKSRVETVMRVSREVGDEGQLSGVIGCWLRNRRVHRAGRDRGKMLADLERLLAYPD